MAKKFGVCKDPYCEKLGIKVEADEFDFVCDKCHRPLTPDVPDPPPCDLKSLLILLAIVLGLGGFGALMYNWLSDGSPAPSDILPPTPPPPPQPVGCQPLLMDGKTTLYQRVLTRPDAVLTSQPGGSNGKKQVPFTPFYVYNRQSVAGEEWLHVGLRSDDCNQAGWLRGDATVEWKQQLTLAFTNPAGRERVLFFKQRPDLEDIVTSRDPASKIEPIMGTILRGDSDPRVVAIEPENFIDISKKFYLLPIIESAEIRSGSGKEVRLLRVASINKPADSEPRDDSDPASVSAAVVFAIDTTISMGPYIERTKHTVRRIYERFRTSSLRNQVKFGLVAFRSSLEATPNLEYDAKLFADPNRVPDEQDFLRKVADLRAAPVSSARFDEDAYAGLMLAVGDIDWSPFDGRNIILITDAGALRGDDPLSKTKRNAGDVQDAARDKGILIYAIHLKTPEGQANHASAERQYQELTKNLVTTDPLYYSAGTGSVESFGNKSDCLTNSLVHNVNAVNQASQDGSLLQYCPPERDAALGLERSKMLDDMKLLGLALRLEYLGSRQGTEAPLVFEGWIADKDAKKPERESVDVRVLLSRNDLSNLLLGVREILEAARAGRESASEFYNHLISFASRMARDSSQALDEKNLKISELGILGEYLNDCPTRAM